MAAVNAAGAPSSPPPAAAASAAGALPHAAGDAGEIPLDDTAETIPDTAATLAQEFAKRAEVMLLVQQSQQQAMQLRLDRMKADFNAKQEEHTEAMREMNALRDMALEQSKKDDEVLKKYIAMI